ncbi:MAG: hypothetical protein SPI30_05925 [Prevotella sp.]|nr:hypothetical protein [Prevotella sp.]
MKKNQLMMSFLACLLTAIGFVACSDDPERPELPVKTAVNYTLTISPDMARFYDFKLDYLLADGTQKEEVVRRDQETATKEEKESVLRWQYKEEIEGVRYNRFKMKIVAYVKDKYVLEDGIKSYNLNVGFIGNCTNYTPTYTYAPNKYIEHKMERDAVEAFLKANPKVDVLDWENPR